MQKVKTILSIIKNGWSALILLLLSLATFGQEKNETLKINWPDEYNWQTGSDQKTESVRTIELIPGNKKNGEESIKATMICLKGVQYSPMEIVMNNTFNNIIKNAPKALMTLIERDKDAKNHWILFKIESIGSKTDRTSESRIYYIVQGDYSLY
ncbi:MAG TPA: hypothetical protein DIT07_15955, partial [Sphingobacteriaceae bacterium]|nr:hypothetical protein [Sphingobacteriaceae bacterium]